MICGPKFVCYPERIKSGKTTMIPSFFYLRLMHKEMKGYVCEIKTMTHQDETSEIEMSYPELDRKLCIRYKTDFPHTIESWTESYVDGWGEKAQRLETKGTKITSIRSRYWEQNDNANEKLRADLGLEL